ncbi:hypothetical protein FRB91_001267 [Serendipita sp. 411]|nr:hypothetical protein FRB91_001267 [Serendipita sp. 411]KAG9055352.1 hypothetical protein FS842_002457 [Serendipita sp. 407]
MVSFTPLSGGACSDFTLPLAYVLDIDGAKILLDCGSPDWHAEDDITNETERYKVIDGYCTELRRLSPEIDVVLISHGDLAHAGLYAYAHAHWGLSATTYTTLPVRATARIASLEEAMTLRSEEDVDHKPDEIETSEQDAAQTRIRKAEQKRRIFVPTVEEVNSAFQSIITLRYSQPTQLAGKCQGITITPFPAGHTIGGTVWKIRSPLAGTIVYAVNLNHLKERHLDGSVLTLSTGGSVFEPLARPDVLITDAERALTIGGKRKERDKMLIDLITGTIASGHSLLFPVDSSTRLLELLVLTDQHWAYSRMRAPICLISRTAKELLAFIRNMMEWLGGTISKEDLGESNKNQRRRRVDEDEEVMGALALRFKFIEIFSTPDQLINKFSSREPKLILAVPASLSHGSSRSLFSEFAGVEGNVVVLTERTQQGTLNRYLMDRWEAAQEETEKWQDGKIGEPVSIDRPIDIELRSKIPLQGEELEQFRENQKLEREQAAARKAVAARQQQIRDEEVESSESGSEDSDDSGSGEEATAEIQDQMEGVDWTTLDQEETGLKHQSFDIYLKGHQLKTSNFFKSQESGAPRFRMFPFVERKRRFDDFGEIIDVSSWLRKGKIMDQNAESDESKARRLQKAEKEKEAQPEEAPCKFVTEHISINLRCKVMFVDLEGVHDGRALKNILPHVGPRRLIIVQGTEEATESLMDACKSIKSMTNEVYTPKVGEMVRIGENIENFTVALSDALMSSIKMSQYEDNEIAFVKGKLTNPTSTGIYVLDPVKATIKQTEDVEMANGEDYTTVSTKNTIAQSLPRAFMIGDLKLTYLKVTLNRQGISAEFAGEGILVCRSTLDGEEDTVAVRKTRKGEVRVEGDASNLFYTVREEIYKLHALVETE